MGMYLLCVILVSKQAHFIFFFFLIHRKARKGIIVDIRKPKTFVKAGYISEHDTAIIIHGFNGTQTSQHIMYLKDGD